MRVLGHMFAFCDKKHPIREIEIPESEVTKPLTLRKILDAAFLYGQNDFQIRDCPSLSAGDVIEIPKGKYKGLYLTCCTGFDKLTPEQFKKLKSASPTGTFTDPIEGNL